ncbi:hypothetical protein V8E55_008951 [Tylopilus felleus]
MFRIPSEPQRPLCPPPNLAPDRVNATFYDPMAEPFARLEPVLELHPVDLATWDDGVWADPIFSRRRPEAIDEAWPYRFQVSGGSLNGQEVWIRASDGAWYHGKVVGRAKRGSTRVEMWSQPEGLFWCVEFVRRRCRIRKWLAPLNGDIKPDTEHTLQLLSEAGWLASINDQ